MVVAVKIPELVVLAARVVRRAVAAAVAVAGQPLAVPVVLVGAGK